MPPDVGVGRLWSAERGVTEAATAQVSNRVQLESALFGLVGAKLAAMGHQTASSNGSPVGGFEAILFMADPRSGPGCAPADRACRAPIAGFYRAGSNFREDGQAAGF